MTEPVPAGHTPLRVLYVDDDRINALLFEAICRTVGNGTDRVRVTLAESGAEALESARTHAPDLLVLDLHLPDISGTDLLPRLRAVVGDATLPAVLCTAESPADVSSRALAAGFDRCWGKPVEADELRAELTVLAARRADAGAGG
ncbi:MAG: response regulator [Rubrivivax sp.]